MDDGRTFDDVKGRLDEIVDLVSADGISLDDALALYEEAVRLGMEACDLSESDILDAASESEDAVGGDAAAGGAAAETSGKAMLDATDAVAGGSDSGAVSGDVLSSGAAGEAHVL